jgi:hypothetical protein
MNGNQENQVTRLFKEIKGQVNWQGVFKENNIQWQLPE